MQIIDTNALILHIRQKAKHTLSQNNVSLVYAAVMGLLFYCCVSGLHGVNYFDTCVAAVLR